MSQTQKALDRLKRVERDLETVQTTLDDRIIHGNVQGRPLNDLREARASSEVTYLLRLFVEFENGLDQIGPSLQPPIGFLPHEGLGVKLGRMGAQMRISPNVRLVADQDLRGLRNDLLHGRSRIPRLGFDHVFDLMKQFLRWCH